MDPIARVETAADEVMRLCRQHEQLCEEAVLGLEALARSLRGSVPQIVRPEASRPPPTRRRSLSTPYGDRPVPPPAASFAITGTINPLTGSMGSTPSSQSPSLPTAPGCVPASISTIASQGAMASAMQAARARAMASSAGSSPVGVAPGSNSGGVSPGLGGGRGVEVQLFALDMTPGIRLPRRMEHIPSVIADSVCKQPTGATTGGAFTAAMNLRSARSPPLPDQRRMSPGAGPSPPPLPPVLSLTPATARGVPSSAPASLSGGCERSSPPDSASSSTSTTRVYVAGGLTRGGGPTALFDEYDPCERAWRTVGELPGVARSGLTLTALGPRCVVAIGGTGFGGAHQARVDIFDRASASWIQAQPLASPRWAHAAAALDATHASVIGGHTDEEGPHAFTRSCEVYDANANVWYKMPPLRAATITQHGGMGAAVIGMRLFVVSDTYVEVLDLGSGRWHAIPSPLPHPRRGYAVAACDDNLYVMGGYAGGKCVDIVERFDAAGGFWVTLPPLPGGGRTALQAAGTKGRLFVAGGHEGDSDPMNTCAAYDAASGLWSPIPPMPAHRQRFGMALLP